ARLVARSGELPERAGEAEPLEDRLVLLARVRNPARREPVVPPGVRQLRELGDRDRRAGGPAGEPAIYVLLRPEEIHRASGEDDVVPPVRRRDEAMEKERLVVGPLVAHLDLQRLAAVGARRLDPAVRIERSADPEGIPGAVSVPPTATRLHAIGGWHDGEGVQHPQLVAGGIKDD